MVLKKKINIYLQLIRLPNIFTSLADSLAGYLVVADNIKIPILICLPLASACIYGAGCILNDFCDIGKDSRERPTRPIPSGRASRLEALILFSALSVISLILSGYIGIGSFVLCFILILMVIVYNSITKERPILGPLNMALCRALNLLFGMSAVIYFSKLGLLFVAVTFVYVLSLTILSDYEMRGEPGKKVWLVVSGFICVFCILGYMGITDRLKPDSLFFLVLLLFFIGPLLIKTIINMKPENIGHAIKYLVLGIPLLDAVYVAGVQSWGYAVPVGLCTLISILIARYFYVT